MKKQNSRIMKAYRQNKHWKFLFYCWHHVIRMDLNPDYKVVHVTPRRSTTCSMRSRALKSVFDYRRYRMQTGMVPLSVIISFNKRVVRNKLTLSALEFAKSKMEDHTMK